MSILTKVKKAAAIALRPSIITGHSKYLFILSHMRSRSSALSHVLGSNDGVCGYSELHRSYVRYIDIIKMRINLYHDLKCDLRGKYLLDKILHNKLEISKEVLEAVNPKVILLLRDPESTLKSIVNLTGVDWHKNPERASEYYCSRLSRLAEYAEIFEGNYFFVDSDDLVNKTDHVLRELTGWLGLDTPLVNGYMEFSNTGKSGYGDPSEEIRAGRLTKTKGYPDVKIPLEAMHAAESSYAKCKAALTRHNPLTL